MKKPTKVSAELDLDMALEELAKRLRPSASGSCGQTAIPSNAYHTKGETCGCPCCSSSTTNFKLTGCS
jgi:hypothetical protein